MSHCLAIHIQGVPEVLVQLSAFISSEVQMPQPLKTPFGKFNYLNIFDTEFYEFWVLNFFEKIAWAVKVSLLALYE